MSNGIGSIATKRDFGNENIYGSFAPVDRKTNPPFTSLAQTIG